MSDINVLVRKRECIKSKLTIFDNYLNKLQLVFNETKLLTSVDIIELEGRIARNESIINEFNDIQLEIEMLSENLDNEFKERENFDDHFFKSLSAAKRLYSDLNVSPSVNGDPSSPSVREGSSQEFNVKLPTIKLPTFDGSYSKWLEYCDTYESLIHMNVSLNNVQKYHYLKASLQGEPSQVIDSLQMSAENYDIAWNLIKERYENKKLLIHSHIKSIFNINNVEKESSLHIKSLIDDTKKHLRALKKLEQPVEQWDALVIFIITSRLDKNTNKEWESHSAQSNLPTLDQLLDFLRNKAQVLDKLEFSYSKKFEKLSIVNKNTKAFVSSDDTNKLCCCLCKGNHKIHTCQDFLKQSINERISIVKSKGLCLNCLREGHLIKQCKSSNCRTCNLKHNTLLHLPQSQTGVPHSSNVVSTHCMASSQVLLSTANVTVFDKYGKPFPCRVLLDSGSQSNFITSELCNKLGLRKGSTSITVLGINEASSAINTKCNVQLKSRVNDFRLSIACFVLPTICTNIPKAPVDVFGLPIPKNITLADPNFNMSAPIDILLGASCFWQLLCVGQIKLGRNLPVLQKTRFGWLVSGPISVPSGSHTHCNFTMNFSLQQQLAKFWEIEEYPYANKFLSDEEQKCESHFSQTTTRQEDGRFVVSIPFKESPSVLGDSRQRALNQFLSQEKKMRANPEMHYMYKQFMDEYIHLGHMTISDPSCHSSYYMPHHGVLKNDSLTTKLRVVFNASSPSSTGQSLNDIQMLGPATQDELFSIMLRFRKHPYVLSGDIAKMYRQVLVKPEQRSYQRILWRSEASHELISYDLKTVTYGTKSGSYLSTRCIKQLADENALHFPEASKAISRDMYVDDLLTGADSVQELVSLRKEIAIILQQGCFEMRKWLSNDHKVLEDIHESFIDHQVIKLDNNEANKTLGLLWSSAKDCLMYEINFLSISSDVTKRTILSTIARIFDPLGLLGCCLIVAKLIIQKLWLENIGWDESIPMYLHTKWLRFIEDINLINNIEIPRFVLSKGYKSVELHTFADASSEAYGACVYVRTRNSDGNIQCHLLCAKSKVAPLKTLTIPKLELCASLLAARLANSVINSMSINFTSCTYWSDSTVVLSWIRTSPSMLKPFVSHRVAEIQTLTLDRDSSSWQHVSSKNNPADLISRGVSPFDLKTSSLWWNGPSWIFNESIDRQNPPLIDIDLLPETKKLVHSFISTSYSQVIQVDRFSNYLRLLNAVAYALRFIQKCRSPTVPTNSALSCQEINDAFTLIIRQVQREAFPEVLDSLLSNQDIAKSHRIAKLCPFVDQAGIIRVGGRLENSNFAYEKKHPILLPNNNHFTNILFRHQHKVMLHAGSQQLLASIRENFWPLRGQNIARKTIHDCITCYKVSPKIVYPLMGNLPKDRLTVSFPFTNVGIDYAGPINLKDRKGRGSKSIKAYICLYVCFSTKAIHLELITDMTANAFIASLRRFSSRRGKPSRIYSDNGTNFVGANKELSELGNFIHENSTDLSSLAKNEGIDWKFLPPSSPHMGGLWEAGIKSMKNHIKRVVGNTLLTFEDFYTVLNQIEAVLNSRPLFPSTNDPNDFEPITPSHFLIGRSMTSVADPDVTAIPENRLSLLQRIQAMRQHFWQRWSKEYITLLQNRQKWMLKQPNILKGQLVLIKSDNLSPLMWKTGRIVDVHPGMDGIVRAASVATSSGTLKRPATKLCVLPV